MALVLDKLVLMSSLHETQPTIQRLLSGNEFSGKQIMFDTMSIKITFKILLYILITCLPTYTHLLSRFVDMNKVVCDQNQVWYQEPKTRSNFGINIGAETFFSKKFKFSHVFLLLVGTF